MEKRIRDTAQFLAAVRYAVTQHVRLRLQYARPREGVGCVSVCARRRALGRPKGLARRETRHRIRPLRIRHPNVSR